MADLPRSVALVYDSVNKWGGAEVVLAALHQLFPQAPLYTAVYNSQTAPWAKIFPQVIPSFLQRFPFAKSHRDFYPFLTPLAFESFDFSEYEAVISVTSADAKGILTSPATFHLSYCLTPTRYYWSHSHHYLQQILPPFRPLARAAFSYGRNWDQVASSRPDAYVAISRTVQKRIHDYYGRESTVVYPPADLSLFAAAPLPESQRTHFLYSGRLVSYKNPHLVISAFNQLNLPLLVVGTGPLLSQLRRLANPNIQFTGFVDKNTQIEHYRHALALIYFHEEDYGITPVEAQAAGTPVLGVNLGGVSETVISGKTGLLSSDISVSSLVETVQNFFFSNFDVKSIQQHANSFDQPRFLSEFAKVVAWEWTKYKNISTS